MVSQQPSPPPPEVSASAVEALIADRSLCAWREGTTAYLQIHRPNRANSYTQPMLHALESHLRTLADDDTVRVLVITGSGERSFCAGADRDEIAQRDWLSPLRLKSASVFRTLRTSRFVSLAAINGAAVGGGCELALACDLRLATLHSQFWLPEPELGLLPAAGGIPWLTSLVGGAKARELILGGNVWTAEEALRIGLVSEIVPADDLLTRAQAWSLRIARRDALALDLAKQSLECNERAAVGGFDQVAQCVLSRRRSDPSQ